jgi:hypothetical protein
MSPCAFDQENTILDPPEGMSCDQVSCMSAYRGMTNEGIPITISCWRLSREELEEITRTGRCWLLMMGHDMSPSHITGANPFCTDGDLP